MLFFPWPASHVNPLLFLHLEVFFFLSSTMSEVSSSGNLFFRTWEGHLLPFRALKRMGDFF